jgi:hypothetical protein
MEAFEILRRVERQRKGERRERKRSQRKGRRGKGSKGGHDETEGKGIGKQRIGVDRLRDGGANLRQTCAE